MPTYFVKNSGSDAASGLSDALAWQTIAHVNSQSFSPGDIIQFNRGDLWREQLQVPNSGSVGSPITITSYGTGAFPIITGFDVMTGFTLNTGTVYQKTGVTTQPSVVAYNGTLLKFDHVGTSILANEWDWAANVLYINVGNPVGTVEAGQRNFSVYFNNKSYMIVDSVGITGANVGAVFLDTAAANIIVQNSDIHHTKQGIGTASDVGNNNTFQSNKIHDTVEYGINIFANTGTGYLIQNNEIYNVGSKGGGSTNMSGIFAQLSSGLTISRNYIHDGGDDSNGDHCMYISAVSATSLTRTIVKNNILSNWSANGIKFSNCDFADAYYNVIFGMGKAGFVVESGTPSFINMYNNTIANSNPVGGFGVWITAGDTIAFKNNVIYNVNWSPDLSRFNYFIDNTPTNLSFDYNCVFDPTPNVGGIYANYNTVQKTWVQWQALGFDAHGFNIDPLFMNAPANDFRLTPGSPIFSTGLNLGGPYNIGFDNRTPVPPGALLDQNTHPAAWSIGAFVPFTSTPPVVDGFVSMSY